MSKVQAGIVFEFDTEEIREEFPEMTTEEIYTYIRGLTTEDIERFVKYNELFDVVAVKEVPNE